MKRMFAPLFLTLTLVMFAGCQQTSPTTPGGMTLPASMGSPEKQIATAANAETAAIGLATALLKNNKITVAQAKSYSGILHAASSALEDANKTLLECRQSTNSTSAANPDPCAFSVADIIKIATTTITGVQTALATK